MMTCREYIFMLSSGQLEHASRGMKMQAATHRMICKRCRTFTRNDRALDGLLEDYRQHLKQPDDSADQ